MYLVYKQEAPLKRGQLDFVKEGTVIFNGNKSYESIQNCHLFNMTTQILKQIFLM